MLVRAGDGVPVISHVEGNSPFTGGASISIMGSGFGSTDSQPTAFVAGRLCSATWVSDNLVRCFTQDPALSTTYHSLAPYVAITIAEVLQSCLCARAHAHSHAGAYGHEHTSHSCTDARTHGRMDVRTNG